MNRYFKPIRITCLFLFLLSGISSISLAFPKGDIIGCNNRVLEIESPTGKGSVHPLAIAMWDFSWLERRWEGAGYEDWDKALDELVERGYDAVRIDPYPHLLAADPTKVWELLPEWSVQDWGAPARCRIQVQPNLNTFIRKCKERKIKVALSAWFREDIDNIRLKLTTPESHVQIWKKTLESIASEGLLDAILYLDCNNEFPYWCQFLPSGFKRNSPEGLKWMRQIEEGLRHLYPEIPFTFSFVANEDETWLPQNVKSHDFLEIHVWMANYSDFYKKLNYNYERFDTKGYDRIQLNAESLYNSDKEYYQNSLKEGIQHIIDLSKRSNLPVITTECWGIVDYKDFPMLNWGWVKDLCTIGVENATKSGRWVAIATSNFCGPQFKGMWNDIAYHRKLTSMIKSSTFDQSFNDLKIVKRLNY